MNITQQPELSKWPATAQWRHNSVGKYIECVYHSPHGSVECYTEVGNAGQHPGTKLRMVLNGIGWQFEERSYYEPDRLLRLASAFANVVREAAGAQQAFVHDGAGMVTMALEFAREAVLGAQTAMQSAGLPYGDPEPVPAPAQ